jgi:hypothetical protein
LTVVVFAVILQIKEPREIGLRVDQVRMRCCKRTCAGPERGKRASIVEDVHVEAILEIVVAHKTKDVVVNVAEIVDLK